MITCYESLIAIAELGSVSLAAKKIFLTQSALSHHLRALEEHYGWPLMQRVDNRMELTPEGHRIYLDAKKLVHDYNKLKELLVAETGKTSATLKFSTIDSVANSILPNILKQMQNAYPNLQLKTQFYSTPMAIQYVLDEKIDCAIGSFSQIPPLLGFERLFDEPLVVIGGKTHDRIRSITQLSKEPLIIYPRTSMTRRRIDEVLLNWGIKPHILLETSNSLSIVALVESGAGVSIMPYYTVYRSIENGQLKELPFKTKAKREIGLVYKKSLPLSDSTIRFFKICRDETKFLIKKLLDEIHFDAQYDYKKSRK